MTCSLVVPIAPRSNPCRSCRSWPTACHVCHHRSARSVRSFGSLLHSKLPMPLCSQVLSPVADTRLDKTRSPALSPSRCMPTLLPAAALNPSRLSGYRLRRACFLALRARGHAYARTRVAQALVEHASCVDACVRFVRQVCICRVQTHAGAPLSANDGDVMGSSSRDGGGSGGAGGEETRVLLCREHLKMYTSGSLTLAHTIHALISIPHTNK